ncbi:MAG: TerD family protein [Gammaproteobacteria bacterium]|nr:TerD family protein [Candidatus Thioaporhodococcus sediminis]TNF56686.1 MAG: TerD family protein [Gammaproteobacteria bacterium]
MPISLTKGGNVNLSKEAPSMQRALIGLGWDARSTDGSPFDLDASAFMLTANDKVRGDSDFIFYNQPKSTDGSLEHRGDNRTGAGEGDDEVMLVDLTKMTTEVQKVAFTVTIHEADARRQNFGMVRHAYIRILNEGDGKEVARYDLSEDASTEAAMIFGELYRHGSDWKFRAVGQGFAGGLGPLAKNYGVNI